MEDTKPAQTNNTTLLGSFTNWAVFQSYVKEKWQHAGFQKYFRNMGWAFSGRIFSLIISLFIGALVARYLGPQRYGVLNYALSFVTIFAFLSSLGIDSIIIRDLVKEKKDKNTILNTAFVIKLIGGFLVTLLATTSSILLKNDSYTTILILIYSTHLIFASLNVTDSYFQSMVKYKYSFIAQFSSTTAVSLLKIFLIYENFGTGWFVLALVFEIAFSSIILLKIFAGLGNKLSFSINYDLAKKMLTDSWPFILSGAFYFIYTRIDQIMIGKMINTDSLGIYSAGVKLAEIWYFIPSIICAVLFPAIISAKTVNPEQYGERLKKILVTILSISTAIALFEFIFAKYLILILFGQAYLGAVIILKIYTWSGIIVSLIMVLQQYLTIENKTKLIMASSLVGALINIILNFILIPKYGIIGSAWATIVSYAIIPITILIYPKIKQKCFFLKK